MHNTWIKMYMLLYPNLQSEAEGAALNFLVEVIGVLSEDPGKFEKCQKELNSFYIEFSQNNYVISNSIEILFDHVRIY